MIFFLNKKGIDRNNSKQLQNYINILSSNCSTRVIQKTNKQTLLKDTGEFSAKRKSRERAIGTKMTRQKEQHHLRQKSKRLRTQSVCDCDSEKGDKDAGMGCCVHVRTHVPAFVLSWACTVDKTLNVQEHWPSLALRRVLHKSLKEHGQLETTCPRRPAFVCDTGLGSGSLLSTDHGPVCEWDHLIACLPWTGPGAHHCPLPLHRSAVIKTGWFCLWWLLGFLMRCVLGGGGGLCNGGEIRN